MTRTVTKLPVKTDGEKKDKEAALASRGSVWHPFESLRHEIDRVFGEFDRDWRLPFSRSVFDAEPFGRHELSFGAMPLVDIVEREKEYEINAELPGLDEKNIDISLSDGTLTIKGEKHDEKEENRKGYHMSERHYGRFQRAFRVPPGVDNDKIEARFAKGVLKITLPKGAQAQQQEKKIAVKSA